MNYRKKPVVVQAHQWFKNGDHPDDNVMRPFEDTGETPKHPREGSVVRYYRHPDVPGNRTCEHCREIMHIHGWIDTKEGGHIVCPADWIITGVKGERYPCKPDIFALTYEPEGAVRPEGGLTVDLALSAIASEPELPDDMPDGMWTYLQTADRDGASEAFRAVVRATKKGIRERLLSALGMNSRPDSHG